MKKEYGGSENIKGIQVLNLIQEFEMQRMKESKAIKDYADKFLTLTNKVRLLGYDFPYSRIAKNILVTILENFEATITFLENSRFVKYHLGRIVECSSSTGTKEAHEKRRFC